uniref:Secreted Nerve growth factor-like protein n=1 Tax=Pristhesancus plagipennis TaxID=1955184 RepID=A0A2K8JS62_PRIPG|nr:secreted Nerve growth factor-like protein [Pristhesancus plagipennis]
MRIAINIILIAVVSLAARAVGWQGETRSTNSNESSGDSSFEGEEPVSTEGGTRWLSHRESQMLLRREGGEQGLPVDCCPSTLEMVEPKGGTNQEGMLVTLYSDGENKQRFYELSCRQGVEGKPCRFMDRKLHNQSRCVQKYSYTYALVKQPSDSTKYQPRQNHFKSFPPKGSNWMLDYIRVRSGCSCEVTPRTKRKRTSHKGKHGKNRRVSEEEPN